MLAKIIKKILGINVRIPNPTYSLQQNSKYSGHLKILIVGLSGTRVTRVVGLLVTCGIYIYDSVVFK